MADAVVIGPIRPGTSTSVGLLKQVEAGLLNVGYAEAGPDAGAYAGKFTGRYEHRVIGGGVGHNLPQEAPQAFAQAIADVDAF